MSPYDTVTDQRQELLTLARIIAENPARQRFADELVPLLASAFCDNALGVFSDLVTALDSEDPVEAEHQLDVLCGEGL
jgi:hypothetical protein